MRHAISADLDAARGAAAAPALLADQAVLQVRGVILKVRARCAVRHYIMHVLVAFVVVWAKRSRTKHRVAQEETCALRTTLTIIELQLKTFAFKSCRSR